MKKVVDLGLLLSALIIMGVATGDDIAVQPAIKMGAISTDVEEERTSSVLDSETGTPAKGIMPWDLTYPMLEFREEYMEKLRQAMAKAEAGMEKFREVMAAADKEKAEIDGFLNPRPRNVFGQDGKNTFQWFGEVIVLILLIVSGVYIISITMDFAKDVTAFLQFVRQLMRHLKSIPANPSIYELKLFLESLKPLIKDLKSFLETVKPSLDEIKLFLQSDKLKPFLESLKPLIKDFISFLETVKASLDEIKLFLQSDELKPFLESLKPLIKDFTSVLETAKSSLDELKPFLQSDESKPFLESSKPLIKDFKSFLETVNPSLDELKIFVQTTKLLIDELRRFLQSETFQGLQPAFRDFEASVQQAKTISAAYSTCEPHIKGFINFCEQASTVCRAFDQKMRTFFRI